MGDESFWSFLSSFQKWKCAAWRDNHLLTIRLKTSKLRIMEQKEKMTEFLTSAMDCLPFISYYMKKINFPCLSYYSLFKYLQANIPKWCTDFPVIIVQLQSPCLTLQPHGLQHIRLPCLSLSPKACPNSYPLSQWCHPTISTPVTLISSCPQSFPTSGSFSVSQFFASGNQSIGASASASALPMKNQDWFPLGWTGWVSLQSKSFLRVFSNTTVQKHQFFSTQPSLLSNSHIHTWLLEKL